MVSKFPF